MSYYYFVGNPSGPGHLSFKDPPSNNAAIIRPFQGPLHREMVTIPQRFHEYYCNIYDMDLVHIEDLCEVRTDYGWFRWHYIKEALGYYEHVFYLEPDTMIANLSIDLRNATINKPLAMRYGSSGGIEPPHFQCGVIYARRDPKTLSFLESILSLCPPHSIAEESNVVWWKRLYCQQTMVNQMLQPTEEWIGVLPVLFGGRYLRMAEKLPGTWNMVDQDFRALGDLAIVRAWHGSGPETSKQHFLRAEAERVLKILPPTK